MLFIAQTVIISTSGFANADLTVIGTANYLGNDYNLIYDDAQAIVWLDYTRGINFWVNHLPWVSELGENLTINLYPGYATSIDWSTG